jgi:hypothetical protein
MVLFEANGKGNKKAETDAYGISLPPGFKLSDIFMDGQQVMQEMNITSRTLQSWRSNGKISYTNALGKIYYFRHEIAALLIKKKQNKSKKTAVRSKV